MTECEPILHNKIKASRRWANLTQQQLADQLGVSRPAVSLWESTDPKVRNEPTRRSLRKLAALTGAPLHWLMDDGDDTRPEALGARRDIETIYRHLSELSDQRIQAVLALVQSYQEQEEV